MGAHRSVHVVDAGDDRAIGVDDVAIKSDMKNFKKFIEERGAEDGAWRGTVTN